MSEIDTSLLYASLDAQRLADHLSWRDVAVSTGLSASTFSRMLKGQQPNLDAYVVLCRWLGMPMETFTGQRVSKAATLDSELVALLHRHGMHAADRDFVLSAYRTLSEWRSRQVAA